MESIKIKRVLIFGLMGIGNFILFIPTIKAFKRYFSDAKFYLVVYPKSLSPFKQILESLNLIDEYIVFNGRYAHITEQIKFIKKIRKEKFDLLIKNFCGGLNYIIPFLHIPYRIGHVSSPHFPIKFSSVFNYKVKMAEHEHEIDRNLKLFLSVSAKKELIDKNLSLPDTRTSVIDNHPSVVMQIGTTAEWKEWDINNFAILANKLIAHNIKVILLGDKSAVNKSSVIEKIAPDCINLVGKTSIKEALEVIKKCSLVICNDGGLMWIAHLVNKPVLAIFGPTDYRRTSPLIGSIIRKDLSCSPCYNSPTDYKKVIKCKKRKCLELISVEEVFSNILQYFSL